MMPELRGNVGSCRAIGQLRIKAQRLEAESRPSHGRSYWKRTEEKRTEVEEEKKKTEFCIALLAVDSPVYNKFCSTTAVRSR
jgi:hypothetical protein